MSTKLGIFCNSLLKREGLTKKNMLYFKCLQSNINLHLIRQTALFGTSSINYQDNKLANVDFVNGLIKLTIKLPARGDLCEFNFKMLNDTVGTLVDNLKLEDKSIEKAQLFTNDGIRISQNTSISTVITKPFTIKINDDTYHLEPPSSLAKTTENLGGAINDLEEIKKLVSKLYLHLNIEHYEKIREDQIVKELELLKTELQPMEEVKEKLSLQAKKHTNRMIWLGLGLMAVQAGVMARLTWFDYSWDIVEPISYFVTYSAVVGTYAYFVLTRKEYDYANATDRIFLRNFHKNAQKINLDVNKYNNIKDSIYKLENDLNRIKASQLKSYQENK